MTVLHSDINGINITPLVTTRTHTPKMSRTPTAPAMTAWVPALVQARTEEQDKEVVDDERDIETELRADGENPFPIDRRAIKDVILDRLGLHVERVRFLSSGTFHKAFLLHLDQRHQGGAIPQVVVFRIARRTMHMPTLKTESEVATLAYLRTRTSIPVPTVYCYDSNPYNVLGGEWMVMSKAPGVPLSKFYHNLSQDTLRALLRNLVAMLIPLFEHRFPAIGSLYFARSTSTSAHTTTGPTPPPMTPGHPAPPDHFVPGPIISYPFFGSSRGLLSHLTKPPEIDRGPWATFAEYLDACMQREINGVIREGQGMEVGRRPRVAPRSEGDSDSSSTSGSGSESETETESEDDWGVNWNHQGGGRALWPTTGGGSDSDTGSDTTSSGPETHASHYRDYRATQRSTFLVAHTARREAAVREEMGVFLEVMGALREEAEGGLGLGEFGARGKGGRRRRTGEDGDGDGDGDGDVAGEEAFTLDCHDLSLENVFVDEHDPATITCIIDWESTCIRPLFQAAHLPAFLQPHHGHGHGHGHHHGHHHHSHGHGHHHHSHGHGHGHHHRSHGQTPHRPHLSRTHSSAAGHGAALGGGTPLGRAARPRYVPPRGGAAQVFREEVARYGGRGAGVWLALEEGGAKRRWAHGVVEWDGWEEGLAGEVLGELEYGWEVECAEAEGEGGRRERREVGGGGGVGRRADRDASADGGRELGRRLEQWVREGANVAVFHDEG